MAHETLKAINWAVEIPAQFYILLPEAAMARAGLPRKMRELTLWRMSAALNIDMTKAIKSGQVTRDTPLDLLVSMARRCAACDQTRTCRSDLTAASDQLREAPEYCRIKNRLAALQPA